MKLATLIFVLVVGFWISYSAIARSNTSAPVNTTLQQHPTPTPTPTHHPHPHPTPHRP
jgi:ABC-type nickel/cobalt efflux system permease component RcnA